MRQRLLVYQRTADNEYLILGVPQTELIGNVNSFIECLRRNTATTICRG
jgi:hypothetical protein